MHLPQYLYPNKLVPKFYFFRLCIHFDLNRNNYHKKITLLSSMQKLHVPFVIQIIPDHEMKGKSLRKESR